MFTVNEGETTWQRAKAKASDKRPEVRIDSFGSYSVAGSKGDRYVVTIDEDELGTHIACTCLAGSNDKPCYHASAALKVHNSFMTVSAPVRDKRLSLIESDLNFIRNTAEEMGGDFELMDDICRAVRSALQSLFEYELGLQPASDERRARVA